jgi:phage-related holin
VVTRMKLALAFMFACFTLSLSLFVLLCTGAADSLSEVNGAVVILVLHSHSSLIRTKPALT